MTLSEAKRLKSGDKLYHQHGLWDTAIVQMPVEIVGKTTEGKVHWQIMVAVFHDGKLQFQQHYLTGLKAHIWTTKRPEWYSRYGQKGLNF